MKNLILFLLLISISGYAQKVKLVQGNLNALKGETSINTEFTYHNMIIGKDKSEQDYIREKKEAYNSKEAGRGEKWENAWYDDRSSRFEPNFWKLFTKYSGMTIEENSKYTLIFHTTRTEPGWNVGVMRAPARIDAEVLIVETHNKDNVIAKITVINAPGRDAGGFDYDTGYRIQEAYSKSGKEVGKLFKQ